MNVLEILQSDEKIILMNRSVNVWGNYMIARCYNLEKSVQVHFSKDSKFFENFTSECLFLPNYTRPAMSLPFNNQNEQVIQALLAVFVLQH